MIDRQHLADLRAAEDQRFLDLHPRSAELAAQAGGSLLAGVPMPWMTRWPGAFPLFCASASGARPGALAGAARPKVTEALARQASLGITTMLPSADGAWVGEELSRRFGLPAWQLAMSATDANRFVLRFARHLTGRPRIAVMDWCYHGTVDETLAVLDADRLVSYLGAPAPQVDQAANTVRF